MTRLEAPVLVGDLPLDAPLPGDDGDARYRGARLLTWLHGRPVAEVTLPLTAGPLTPDQLAAQLWPLVADEVAAHCAADGLAVPDRLPATGLPPLAWRRCPGQPVDSGLAVTVVIATRDRPEALARCLESVAACEYPAFDVVVVDSAPRGDSTPSVLASREWPFEVRYVRVPKPGLALAHNAALGEITGDIIAFTDDDVAVDPHWLAALAAPFTDPAVACVTGLILPAELETPAQLLVEEAGGYARGFTRQTFTAGMPGAPPLFPFTAGRFGSGANMAFRARWLLRAGGFDPATGAGTPARGGDDLAAFLRVITDGAALVYEPAAVIRHWHRREYEGLRRQAFGYGVGLGAYLTAAVWRRPRLLGPMLARLWPALRHLLSSGSVKNSGREPGFPRELIWRERLGVLAGPFCYARSRWRYRQPVIPRRYGAARAAGPRHGQADRWPLTH